jgi:hypothetical protein
MASRIKRARWIVTLAALTGTLGWAASQAYAVVGEGENFQYNGYSGGGYCAGKCNPSEGACC